MARSAPGAAGQMGPIVKDEPRQSTVARMISMMRQAKERGADLIVYPELALTTFFPRYWMDNQEDVDAYFERDMPGPATQPLFDEAMRLGIGFHLGYAELAVEEGETRHFNSSILVDRSGRIVAKYRKIHLPGYAVRQPEQKYQNLEKLYFDVGNLGIGVTRAFGGLIGLCICNDRRWPETYSVKGLQGVEMILLGYNTPNQDPGDLTPTPHADFHNLLSMQAGAYQNATWVVGVAKAGVEEDIPQIGGTCIIAPSGDVVAQAKTLGDELVVAKCDLDMTRAYKEGTFNFSAHRRTEHYGLIIEQTGAVPPLEE